MGIPLLKTPSEITEAMRVQREISRKETSGLRQGSDLSASHAGCLSLKRGAVLAV